MSQPPSQPESNLPSDSVVLQTEEQKSRDEEPQATPASAFGQEEFYRFLEDNYGVNAEQFQQVYQQYQSNPEQFSQNAAMNSLQQAWNVDQGEVSKRLRFIGDNFKGYLEKHPEDDTVEGAIKIWELWESMNRAAPQPDKPSNVVTRSPVQPRYEFTESQIQAMSPEERRRNDARIIMAYADGRVDSNS